MDGYIAVSENSLNYFTTHPAIFRIKHYLDIFKSGNLSYNNCLVMCRKQIEIIENYNKIVGKLNLQSFNISSTLPEPLFYNVNLRQKFPDGKNLLDYAISHPRVVMLLTQKGIFSKSAIINCIKYKYHLSLYVLLEKLKDYNGYENINDYTYNRLLIFLEQILDITVKDGGETPLLYISQLFGDLFPYLGNIPLVTSIIYGYKNKFDFLIESGMNIQKDDNESGLFDHLSPIEAACVFKRCDFIKKLIDLGVDLNNHDAPSLVSLICSPPSIRESICHLEKTDLYNTLLLLVKNGLDLNQMQGPVISAYKETIDMLNNMKNNNKNNDIKYNDIKKTITNILHDCVLITEALKISSTPINKKIIIKAIFFDLYFKEMQYLDITSQFFNKENLIYFIKFMKDNACTKQLESLVYQASNIGMYFNTSISNLSLITQKIFKQYKKTCLKIIKLANIAVNNLENISADITKKNSCHVFNNICSFLDGPSLNSLSSIKYDK